MVVHKMLTILLFCLIIFLYIITSLLTTIKNCKIPKNENILLTIIFKSIEKQAIPNLPD